MNIPPSVLRLSARLLRIVACLGVCLGLTVRSVTAADAAPGSITGSVSSAKTRNGLQGATVRVPALNIVESTDSAGRFSIKNLPSGVVEIVTSYSGFNESRQKVSVTGGSVASVEIELATADVLTMAAFTVDSVKEGASLAITQQRNAGNIKNVAAMDEWGTLPTMSVGELAMRMPGISGDLDPEDGVLRNISIRGMSPEFSRMTIDGMSASAVGGNGRTATLYSFSGAMYEQIEIIAGQTPDKKADSIGGQFNLKTRSPLSMREDRRTSYNVGLRWSPSWAERTPYRADHPIHPVVSVSHQQVFSVFGGNRNLGISLNASYSEVVGDKAQDRGVFQLTTNPVAFFNDYISITGLNHRIVYGLSARADYQLSPSSRFMLSAIYNEGAEPFDITAQMNAWTNSTIATFDANGQPTNTGGVLPGFTADRTSVRPIPGGIANVTSSRMDLSISKVSFYSRNPTITFAGEHEFGRLKFDHAARFSHTAWDLNSGSNEQGGTLTLRAENIGFTLDKSNLDGRVFTQTQGPSVYDPANYTANYVYTKRNRPTTITEGSANVNVTYNLDTRFPIFFKAGGDFTERRFNAQNRGTRQWTRVTGAPVSTAALLPITRFEEQHPGGRLPFYDPTAVNQELSNPALWTEDLYRPFQQLYVSRLLGVETVPAAYVMSQAKINRLTLLVGVRYEDVQFENFTYIPKAAARQLSATQEPNPARRAAANYTEVEQEGGYDKYYPSYHAAYDVTANFKARASWSTSYGRPTFQQLIPAFSVNETTRVVSGGNPNLRAQFSENIDLKLEYYTKSGLFSVGAFRKDISDYIGSVVAFAKVPSGVDNGFDGFYDGFDVTGPLNLGSARVEGIEFDARQRLTFLPGPLKGLTASANYTQLATEGRFEGTVQRSTNQIAGFIPRAGNARLYYVFKKFGASVAMNYTGEHLWQFSTTAANNIFRKKFVTYSAGVNYRLRPNVTASIDVGNITNEGLEYYAVYEDRLRRRFKFGSTINFGLSGTF
jgi:TonB-dependent receptor